MSSGKRLFLDNEKAQLGSQTLLDRFEKPSRAYRPRSRSGFLGRGRSGFGQLGFGGGGKGGFNSGWWELPQPREIAPIIKYLYPTKPKLSLKPANLGMFFAYEYLKRKYGKIIQEAIDQPHQPYVLDRTGTNWVEINNCGPWREDSVLVGGNFCFVGNGVPPGDLYQSLPAGVSNCYTVQINGGEVPGGIDCTAARMYESTTPFNPDPVPVWKPGPRGPILPEVGRYVNPYDPTRTHPFQLVPYPKPRPIRGPHAASPPHSPTRPRPRAETPATPPWPGKPPGRHVWRPPGPGVKEKKTNVGLEPGLRMFKRALGLITEGDDFLDAVYGALPWEVRRQYLKKGGLTAQEKLRILYRHADRIDIRKVIENVVKNEIEDRVIGGIGRKIKQATRSNPYWVSPVGPQAGGRYHGARVYM